MMKSYEKDKRFLETEKEQSIHFQHTSPPPHIAVNDTNKIWKVLQIRHVTVENKLVMSKQVIKKLEK